MSSCATITEALRDAVGGDSGLSHSLKFDLKGDGFIHIEGATVSNIDAPADLTMTISLADLTAMGKGEIDPMSAVMSGKLHLSDMMRAMGMQAQISALMGRIKSD